MNEDVRSRLIVSRKQFDPDTRDTIRINVVHGSWQTEDRNGIGIAVGLPPQAEMMTLLTSIRKVQ